MYRFQISAQTQSGESIALVGSAPELGSWDVMRCVRLKTSGDRYPLWWSDDISIAESGAPSAEYKYVRLGADGSVQWEAWGSNRWVPLEDGPLDQPIIVDDGVLGVVQPCPYGYLERPPAIAPLPQRPDGLKIVVIGSSVARGCNAWLLRGWAWHLERALNERYGHQLINVSELGANVSRTIDRFPLVVAPEQPDVVVIALSLGNEGLAYCPPHQQRAVQRRFENGLQQLIKMARELGALPVLAGVYPHGDYSPDPARLLRETHQRMLGWGVPVLDWLAAVGDDQGRWQSGLSFNPSHPNTEGHRRMAEAIDLSLFDIDREALETLRQAPPPPPEIPVYRDDWGFHVFACTHKQQVRVINTSPYPYTISPTWHTLQTSLQRQAKLMPGVYIARHTTQGITPSFGVAEDGTIATILEVPPGTDLEYSAAFHFFTPQRSQTLYYDGHLGLLKEDDRSLRIINESDHEYNIHPMWQEVRRLLQAMPAGVYHDPLQPDAPFRTLMIGRDGLESRVKVPAQSSVLFQYQCALSDISRVAILSLGDRCAVRMLLYRMEYDGPAFPFDLTRTTNLGDVADMIATGFDDMWNPRYLHYDAYIKRIYHRKWTGLSFAHEVEDSDDPVHSMEPVYQRMRDRYSARAARFWYTLKHCDKILFIRTGQTQRGYVVDLLKKLEAKCEGKPFHLLILSPQSSEEFTDLPNVLHRNVDFNPDRMYEDLAHWMYCTSIMRDILESLGVSSKNLFWCPPNPPKD